MKYAIVFPTTGKIFGYDLTWLLIIIILGLFMGHTQMNIARSFYNLYAYYNAIQFVADLRNYSFNHNSPFELIAPVLQPNFQYKDLLHPFHKEV